MTSSAAPTASPRGRRPGPRADAVRRDLAAAVLPPTEPRGRRARTATAVFALMALAVAHLRLSPGAAGSVWAEDGTRFLAGGLTLGPAAVTEPYAGYMHLLPRLLGSVAGSLPLAWAEDVFALGASAVVALCATATLVLARGHLPSLAVRLPLAAMVVLLPSGGLEAAGNSANSHWFLMAAAFWALTSRPVARGSIALAVVVVVLAMGSDPLTVLLAPLALARVLLLRRLRDHVVTASLALTGVVQGLVVLGTERTAGAAPPGPTEVLASYGARVPLVLLGGLRRSPQAFAELGWAAPAVAVLVVAVAATTALVAGPGRLRWLAAAAAVASVTFYVVAATVSWSPGLDPGQGGLDTSTHARYSLVPMLLLLAVGAAGLQAVAEAGRPRLFAGLCVVTALVLGATVAPSFRPDPDLRAGPSWDAGVAAAARACREDPSLPSAPVPLAPESSAWVVGLPCARLR